MNMPHRTNKSVMLKDWGSIPSATIPRSSFRRSHGIKTMFNSGYLIPIYCDEALPGDTFNVKLTSIARLSTPLLPFMDNLHMDFFFFSVPNRLLWENWRKFMGEQVDPGDSTDYTVPIQTTPVGGYVEESLADYMGIPINIDDIDPNALHFRAYNLIWNEWFRAEYIQDSVTVDIDDGPDLDTDYVLLKRGKRHDYFTGCLPWPCKDNEEVELPLGSVAPVVTGDDRTFSATEDTFRLWDRTAGTYPTGNHFLGTETATGDVGRHTVASYTHGTEVTPANLWADLAGATASTINSLREAFQLQKLLERDARGGSRYAEIIKSHFSVDFPDVRYRPEYLGGGHCMVELTPVPSTSGLLAAYPVGELGASGMAAQSGVGFTKSFVEHCTLLGLVCVRADLTYQQGLRKMWSRQTKYDFYWPALAHLGEQEVLNKEIFTQGLAADDDVFGYQERWAEYKYFPSLLTGLMRSDAAGSLDVWHLSQDFGALPVLNSSFIEEDPPVDRVVETSDEPQIIFDGFFDIICARPMPMYSVPGLIDHF